MLRRSGVVINSCYGLSGGVNQYAEKYQLGGFFGKAATAPADPCTVSQKDVPLVASEEIYRGSKATSKADEDARASLSVDTMIY